jgi:hypothetical protein
MTRMTRTQISLDETQHRYLKSTATAREVSVSALLRELVDREMNRRCEDGPHVWELAGLIDDSLMSGRDHDHTLYGHPDVGSPAP